MFDFCPREDGTGKDRRRGKGTGEVGQKREEGMKKGRRKGMRRLRE